MKNGHPTAEVIIPTGNSMTAIFLAIRSQHNKNIPPVISEYRNIFFCPEGMKNLTICGIINPTKPIIPA